MKTLALFEEGAGTRPTHEYKDVEVIRSLGNYDLVEFTARYNDKRIRVTLRPAPTDRLVIVEHA